MRHLSRAIAVFVWALVLSATAEAATITLQWDANPEPDITGYWVSYGTATRTYTVRTNVGKVTSFSVNINPTSASQTWFFAVQAYSPSGTSAYSAEVSTVIAGSNTMLTIDRPAANSTNPSDVFLAGWAVDTTATSGTGIDTLHVYAYPGGTSSGAAPIFLGVAAYGAPRPDVAGVLGNSRFTNSGWSLPIVGLSPGIVWDLAVFAHSTYANAFTAQKVVRINVPTAMPAPTGAVGAIGLPLLNVTNPARVTGWLSVGGWALDRRATTGTGVDVVQVWAYPQPGSGQLPVFLGNAAYGRSRPDVASIFGSAFTNSGFHVDVMGVAPNLYDIVTLGRSTVSGGFEIARVTRALVDPAVIINIDQPSNNGTVGTSFTLSGWAFDKRSTGVGVDYLHVWAYPSTGGNPVFLGQTNVNVSRPDVGAAWGSKNTNSGFSLPLTGVAPGTYDIVLFAHSTYTNSFDNARIVRVTVQ